MKNKATQETSAGCVVYKQHKKILWYALGKHSGYHKWVLSKGLIENQEGKITTAIRETEEELNLVVKISQKKPIHIAKYVYVADFKGKIENSRRVEKYSEQGGLQTKVKKTVYFYLAQYVSGDISKHGWEMSDAGWFSYEDALKKLAFEDEKEALRKTNQYLNNYLNQIS